MKKLSIITFLIFACSVFGQTPTLDELRQKAEQGDVSAQSVLGAMYVTGQGVPKDEAEAIKWLRKAAEQGEATAQYNLGNMYFDGLGVAKDEVEAARWLRKASEQGLAEVGLPSILLN